MITCDDFNTLESNESKIMSLLRTSNTMRKFQNNKTPTFN